MDSVLEFNGGFQRGLTKFFGRGFLHVVLSWVLLRFVVGCSTRGSPTREGGYSVGFGSQY